MNSSRRRFACLLLGAGLAALVGSAQAQSLLLFQDFSFLHPEPKPLPEVAFKGGKGQPVRLADFRGRIVLLNVWATWCAPCRQEMPTLDRLQAKLGGADFEVAALSVDRLGVTAVRDFYAEAGVSHLAVYNDASMKAMRQLTVVGLPMTLLLDRRGREIGRLIGPAEWDAAEIVDFLRRQIEEPRGRSDGPAGHMGGAGPTGS